MKLRNLPYVVDATLCSLYILCVGQVYFSEDGHIEPAVEFPYEDVSRNLGEKMALEFDSDARETLAKLKIIDICRILDWIAPDGVRNDEGLSIRAVIAKWVMTGQAVSETDLAAGLGKKKQSVNRWVEQWKLDFPGIKHPSML